MALGPNVRNSPTASARARDTNRRKVCAYMALGPLYGPWPEALCRKMQRGPRERTDSALGPLYGPRPEALWKNATSATVELSPRPRVDDVTRPSARRGPRPDTALGPTRLLETEKCGVGNSRTVAPAAQRRQQ